MCKSGQQKVSAPPRRVSHLTSHLQTMTFCSFLPLVSLYPSFNIIFSFPITVAKFLRIPPWSIIIHPQWRIGTMPRRSGIIQCFLFLLCFFWVFILKFIFGHKIKCYAYMPSRSLPSCPVDDKSQCLSFLYKCCVSVGLLHGQVSAHRNLS